MKDETKIEITKLIIIGSLFALGIAGFWGVLIAKALN